MKKQQKSFISLVLAIVFMFTSCAEAQESIQNAYNTLDNVRNSIESGTESSEGVSDSILDNTLPGAEDISIAIDPSEQLENGPLEDSYLAVHYINVEQGDAALVICDGHSMLIDGGKRNKSDLIYSYLKDNDITDLDYIVCTHPDADHVGGLSGALNYAAVGRVFCPVTEYESEYFVDFLKYVGQQGKSITVPYPGDVYSLGSASVTILGPVKNYSDTNNMSIVMRIVYGNTSFLFTGDIKEEAEKDILATGREVGSDVIKIAHHGSQYSNSESWLKKVNPEYAVISVGNNAYEHPTDDVLTNLKKNGVKTFRTDLQGHIIAVSDGNEISFSVQKNPSADTLSIPESVSQETSSSSSSVPKDDTAAKLAAGAAAGLIAGGGSGDSSSSAPEQSVPATYNYVANINSYKFHKPTCSGVTNMSEKNKWFTDNTAEELMAMGYEPCDNCLHDLYSKTVKNSDSGKNSSVAEEPKSSGTGAVTYIANKNKSSMKFHYTWCTSVNQMNESNKVYFYGSRDEVINAGYSPCGKCHP